MTRRRTLQDAERRRDLADAAAGWTHLRGDLVQDTKTGRLGVVVALPEDTGAPVYHLRPEGGGDDWTAAPGALQPHPGEAPDGLTLAEAVMPPHPEAEQ